MNIPKKFQVFSGNVFITSKDEERLSPFLRNWDVLTTNMSAFNEPDLERLIVMELMRKQTRRKVIGRLLARLGVAQAETIAKRVWRLLRTVEFKGPRVLTLQQTREGRPLRQTKRKTPRTVMAKRVLTLLKDPTRNFASIAEEARCSREYVSQIHASL